MIFLPQRKNRNESSSSTSSRRSIKGKDNSVFDSYWQGSERRAKNKYKTFVLD